jgi:integrase
MVKVAKTATPTEQEIQELEEAIRQELGRRRQATTVTQYCQLARRFAKYTGKTLGFDRRDALAFLDHIIEDGQGISSVRWTYMVLKKIYGAIDLPYLVTTDDLPRGSAQPNISIMAPQDVLRMIAWVRDKGSPREVVYTLMSTVYGLRRIELSRLAAASFSDTIGTVHIHTAKHGREHTHTVPEELRPHIRIAIDQKALGYGPASLSHIFNDITKTAHIKTRDIGGNIQWGNGREGWHSIRRSLDTGLINNGIDMLKVRFFMRWTLDSRDMAAYYYHASPAAIDKEVFEHHPFLGAWG